MLDRTRTEEGGTWEGKRSGGWEKGNKKGSRKRGKYRLTWTACDRVSY